jgi:hypothetical protein
VLLAVAVLVLTGLLWRVHAQYRQLRERQADLVQASHTDRPQRIPEPVVARLYFAHIVDGEQRLLAISRELPPGLPTDRASLEELIRGEVPRGCDRPLSPGTSVLSIMVTDGIATVDLSEELMIYSVVNTLTSLPDIEEVQILIAGRKVNEIGGHYFLAEPLDFDEELVVSFP